MQEMPKPSAGQGACNLIVNGVLAYLFYVYAFNNPDEGSCFAKEGNEIGQPSVPVITTGSGPSSASTPQAGYIDMTIKFQTWFFYGFILSCIGMGVSIIAFLYHATEIDFCARLHNLLGCVSCCGSLAWLVSGAVFRWSFTGKVCAGDFVEGDDKVEPYAWRSGKFINLYLMIMFSLFGLLCCCGITVGCSYGIAAASS